MALGSNRDYVTRDDRIRANLEFHKKRMEELMEEEGLDRESASEKAYGEIVSGEVFKEIKGLRKKIRDRRNRKK